MKKLIIIGAGGFGREIYWLFSGIKDHGTDLEMKGFLDNRKDILNGKSCSHSVLSSVEDYVIEEGDVFACGISNPKDKQTYCEMILQKGGQFVNIIHPTARISGGSGNCWGQGMVIADNVGISCDVQIGNFVTFNGSVTIGHDAKIGDF